MRAFSPGSLPLLAMLACGAGVLSVAPSSARAAFTKLEGNAGIVNLGEQFGPGIIIEYVVDVIADVRIDGFAVSFDFNSFGIPGVFPLAGNTRSPGWLSQTITPATWNTGYTFPVGDGTVNTADLAPYADIFGDDPRVAIFTRPPGSDSVTASVNQSNDHEEGASLWSDHVFLQNSFFVNSVAASEFIAFTSGGQIIDASLYQVPEPATLAIVVMAVGLYCSSRREF